MKTIYTDKDSVLDYPVDWSEWLEPAETIVAASWACTEGDPSNVVIVPTSVADKTDEDGNVIHSAAVPVAVISFTGTVADGDEYIVTNHITTSTTPSREEDQSIRLIIVEK